MDETAPDPLQAIRTTQGAGATCLTVAYHPREEHLGGRTVLGEVTALGRGGATLGPGVLDDELLSRAHAEVRVAGNRLVLTDCESRNGTFVNGARITRCVLAEGDLVTLGSVVLVVGTGTASEPRSDPTLVGSSVALQRVLSDIDAVAGQDVTVLVRGETGVGKELVARRIHERSGRRGPFVAVNCGGLVDGVVGSELFGHVAGAFSGADQGRAGLVEAANEGTLLLDEIGDASPQLQVSLLRLLQERQYRRVGSNELRTSNARFVAATHVRLDPAVEEGRFRQDLLGRLRRWVVDIPPLRQRREDIVPIALSLARAKLGSGATIERALALRLVAHPWPDNVRGLAAIVDNAAVDAEQGVLKLTDRVSSRLEDLAQLAKAPAEGAVRGEEQVAARFRKERPDGDYLAKRFAALDFNAKALAQELGVSRNTLYRWFRAEGLDPASLRSGSAG